MKPFGATVPRMQRHWLTGNYAPVKNHHQCRGYGWFLRKLNGFMTVTFDVVATGTVSAVT
ncbi:hypothetical protein OH492_10245 [Vibrio chagasii]|nr:hypothetical protein [Vibrio chagasii]